MDVPSWSSGMNRTWGGGLGFNSRWVPLFFLEQNHLKSDLPLSNKVFNDISVPTEGGRGLKVVKGTGLSIS